MKYRIDIWQYGDISESYESDDIKDLVNWYKENWSTAYYIGECTMDIYKPREDIPYEEAVRLGFY